MTGVQTCALPIFRAGDEADYLAKLSEVITLRKEGIPTVLSPEITENEEADQ